MTDTVKQLLIINILFFIGSQFVDAAYPLLSLYFPENPAFKFWQPVTHMFMHGGIMHIFFNMFALISFGSLLEQIWGSKKFLFFYISCGLGAAALHIAVNYLSFNSALEIFAANGFSKDAVVSALNTGNVEMLVNSTDIATVRKAADAYLIPAVGASGAIYGLLVAFAFMFPNAELMMMFIPIPIKAKYFVPAIVALDMYLGVTGKSLFGSGGGVAHFAHIGGALIGFIMMYYWKKNQFNNKRWN